MKLDNIKNKILTALLVAISILTATSCNKDLAAVDPPTTSITQTNVFNTDATAIAAVTTLYTKMAGNSNYSGQLSISTFCGLSADELSLWSGASSTFIPYYQNNLKADPSATGRGSELWSPNFNYIYVCNSAIEQLTTTNSSNISTKVRQQLLGEAKFMRAFFYFYLVNCFGDVPLELSSDYRINNVLPRAPKAQVYQQIIADLHDAQILLSNSYLDGSLLNATAERVRPTALAATALLARAYLYTNNYAGADSAASVLISNPLYSLSPLSGSNSVFLKNSSETIWALQPVSNVALNTLDGYYFIIPSSGPSTTFTFNLSNTLMSSFETGDARKTNWVGTYGTGSNIVYYPYKYKQNAVGTTAGLTQAMQTEYTIMLRLAEQYLIRAEARAQLNNIQGSQDDINKIRIRSGLANTTASSQTALLTAIMHERQVELFTELGHRWFDLKRTATVDGVLTVQTPLKSNNATQWNTVQQLYPILPADIIANPNLIQNPGY